MATKQGERLQRADATRNREAILDAALECLVENPQASMAETAAKAGVGRVTLYGHFSPRGELVLHAAASEVRTGRLDEDEAPSVVAATISAVLRVPGRSAK